MDFDLLTATVILVLALPVSTLATLALSSYTRRFGEKAFGPRSTKGFAFV